MKWALNINHIKPEEMELLAANDTVMKQALDRYKYSDRYPGESVYEQRDLWEQFLKKLEDVLSPFLTGNNPDLVDMALFPFVKQFSQVDPPWFEKTILSPFTSMACSFYLQFNLSTDDAKTCAVVFKRSTRVRIILTPYRSTYCPRRS